MAGSNMKQQLEGGMFDNFRENNMIIAAVSPSVYALIANLCQKKGLYVHEISTLERLSNPIAEELDMIGEVGPQIIRVQCDAENMRDEILNEINTMLVEQGNA
jgi:hypothetical protein